MTLFEKFIIWRSKIEKETALDMFFFFFFDIWYLAYIVHKNKNLTNKK